MRRTKYFVTHFAIRADFIFVKGVVAAGEGLLLRYDYLNAVFAIQLRYVPHFKIEFRMKYCRCLYLTYNIGIKIAIQYL